MRIDYVCRMRQCHQRTGKKKTTTRKKPNRFDTLIARVVDKFSCRKRRRAKRKKQPKTHLEYHSPLNAESLLLWEFVERHTSAKFFRFANARRQCSAENRFFGDDFHPKNPTHFFAQLYSAPQNIRFVVSVFFHFRLFVSCFFVFPFPFDSSLFESSSTLVLLSIRVRTR